MVDPVMCSSYEITNLTDLQVVLPINLNPKQIIVEKEPGLDKYFFGSKRN
jgi:hypothetical protein